MDSSILQFIADCPVLSLGSIGLIGLFVGRGLVLWTLHATHDDPGMMPEHESAPAVTPRPALRAKHWLPLFGPIPWDPDRENARWWPLVVELATPLLGILYVILQSNPGLLGLQPPAITEVVPTPTGHRIRIACHLALIALLIVATATDLRAYLIPDSITLTGVLIGLLAGFLVGDVQIMHLWIDWNQEVPGFLPAYVPPWIPEHPHWHGLAVGVTGLLAGAGITWLVRAIASKFIGEEAMGLGDVTLMAMIGSFLGWQAVLMVFLLAPLCGLLVGLAVRALTGRNYVSFGPYLCAAALIVLFGWPWLWTLRAGTAGQGGFSMRHLFGDAAALGILAGIGLAALVILLTVIRLSRSTSPIK